MKLGKYFIFNILYIYYPTIYANNNKNNKLGKVDYGGRLWVTGYWLFPTSTICRSKLTMGLQPPSHAKRPLNLGALWNNLTNQCGYWHFDS